MRIGLTRPRAILVAAVLVAFSLPARPAQAIEVAQLDVTGGSLTLNLGLFAMLNGSFTQNGTLFMGQFQEPGVFPPFTVSDHTFSLFTNPGVGPIPFEEPSGEVSGSSLTADLRALHAIIAGPQLNGALSLGGPGTGSFNPATRAFSIGFTHLYELPGSGLPLLGYATVTLQGTAALVPLPASLALFATGSAGLIGMIRRRHRKPVVR
jgi:hypothetical protein